VRILPALAVLAALAFGPAGAEPLRVAFFHTELSREGPGLLLRDIARGDPQVDAVRAVIDHAQADVLVLSGIDHDLRDAALAALNAGLGDPYPQARGFPGNRGLPTGRDIDGDGRTGDRRITTPGAASPERAGWRCCPACR